MHAIAAAWTPEQWALIIPILGLQAVGIITAFRHGDRVTKRAETAVGAAEAAQEQVEAVHKEIRPPSNGTTAGAYIEYLAQSLPWIIEELMLIHKTMGTLPRRPPPSMNAPKVKPPRRPR